MKNKEQEKIERDKIYNRVYDDFIKLLKGEIDKVVVNQHEIYELDKKTYFVNIDYQTVRFNNYVDVLRELVIKNGISQTKDIITGDFIFYK